MFPFFRHKPRPPLTPTNFLALIGASETTINSLDEAGVLSLITKRFDRDYKSRRLPWSQSEIATELAIIMNHLNNIAARPDLTLLLEATIGDKMRHTTVITMMKCYALWRSGDLPGLEKNVLDAITRTQVEPNFSSTIGSFIRASVNILPPRPQYHRYIWGEHRRSLEDWLTQSVSRPTTESLSTNLKQNLIEIRHEKPKIWKGSIRRSNGEMKFRNTSDLSRSPLIMHLRHQERGMAHLPTTKKLPDCQKAYRQFFTMSGQMIWTQRLNVAEVLLSSPHMQDSGFQPPFLRNGWVCQEPLFHAPQAQGRRIETSTLEHCPRMPIFLS